MNAREWMNNNSAVVTVAAVVLLVIALGVIFMNLGNGASGVGPIDVYYYDLGSGKLFVAKSNAVPPIAAPSGPYGKQQVPGGVRANVYACGECPGNLGGKTVEEIRKEGARISYLERYTAKAKQAKEKLESSNGSVDIAPGTLDPANAMRIKGMNSDNWVRMRSQEGGQLMNVQQHACPNKDFKPCLP